MTQDQRFNIRAQLKAVPIRNHALKLSKQANGEITFTVPSAPPGGAMGLLKTILRVPHVDKKYHLDPIGSEILMACDGKKTVEKVVEKMAERYKFTFHEARLSVNGFLQTLMKAGAIVISLPEDPNGTTDRGETCAK